MNFATSTQLRHWRLTKDQLTSRRNDARRKFLEELSAGAVTKSEGADAGQPKIKSLHATVDDEQIIVRRWIVLINQELQKPDSQLRVGLFVRATAWTFLHRFYSSHSMLHFPIEAIMPAAILLAAKIEEELSADLHTKVAHVVSTKDKRTPELTELQRQREIVESELSLIVALKGAHVAITPMSLFLAHACAEVQC